VARLSDRDRLIDPEGAETAALAAAIDFTGLRVLELGCGDGRLTKRYAHKAAFVLAADPDEKLIRRARGAREASLRGRVRFAVAGAADIRVPRSSFDLVFFTWSL
jgi:ubiquinone/menaquinone biosynthesis C-methylase UbiE